jgi:hypothetical protein
LRFRPMSVPMAKLMFFFISSGESFGAALVEVGGTVKAGVFWAAAVNCSSAIPNPKVRANFNPVFIVVLYSCLFSAVSFTRLLANVQQEYY